MPTIDENRRAWRKTWLHKLLGKDWSNWGDDWSEAWGGPEAQWSGSILPRIRSYIPAHTILEIAPGYGRWTQFLLHQCERLVVVDLVENCIDACRKRFRQYAHIEYFTNDGKSLNMIDGNSIDFVFSFDSLVHAEANVIESYLSQLAKKLRPNGVGFIHHSNIGAYIDPSINSFPAGVKNRHWRAESMTATRFDEICRQVGLHCIAQELVNWGDTILNDCFSTFTPKDSRWARPLQRVENPNFMDEAAVIKKRARH